MVSAFIAIRHIYFINNRKSGYFGNFKHCSASYGIYDAVVGKYEFHLMGTFLNKDSWMFYLYTPVQDFFKWSN